MNTLCEPLLQEELEQPADNQVWSFQYPFIAPVEFPSARDAGQTERELRLQRAQGLALEAARVSGLREGEAKAEAALAQNIARERNAIADALQQFAEERRSYFRRVEKDVVTLAMAIARKLLHREAQIDPLLLSGVVRVALEQIQAGSQVILRTSPAQQANWQRLLDSLTESTLQITLLADQAIEPGTVLLETSAGKAEIALEDKLKEIESGFLDLLQGEQEEAYAVSTVAVP